MYKLIVKVSMMITTISTCYAQNIQQHYPTSSMESIIDYKITDKTPQVATYTQLSAKKKYSLTCYSNKQITNPQEVTITIKAGEGVLTKRFGIAKNKDVSFPKLTPFEYSGTYNIQYELKTNSVSIQYGVCSFKEV